MFADVTKKKTMFDQKEHGTQFDCQSGPGNPSDLVQLGLAQL